MTRFLRKLLAVVIAGSLLLPVMAIAKQAGEKRHVKITVHPKHPSKHRWKGYGFLPGYRQPPDLTEWRDRSTRYRDRYEPHEQRYWQDGQLRYGWGRPGFYRGRWNGGSFGPCWTWTPIGMMWNCGQ